MTLTVNDASDARTCRNMHLLHHELNKKYIHQNVKTPAGYYDLVTSGPQEISRQATPNGVCVCEVYRGVVAESLESRDLDASVQRGDGGDEGAVVVSECVCV